MAHLWHLIRLHSPFGPVRKHSIPRSCSVCSGSFPLSPSVLLVSTELSQQIERMSKTMKNTTESVTNHNAQSNLPSREIPASLSIYLKLKWWHEYSHVSPFRPECVKRQWEIQWKHFFFFPFLFIFIPPKLPTVLCVGAVRGWIGSDNHVGICLPTGLTYAPLTLREEAREDISARHPPTSREDLRLFCFLPDT